MWGSGLCLAQELAEGPRPEGTQATVREQGPQLADPGHQGCPACILLPPCSMPGPLPPSLTTWGEGPHFLPLLGSYVASPSGSFPEAALLQAAFLPLGKQWDREARPRGHPPLCGAPQAPKSGELARVWNPFPETWG